MTKDARTKAAPSRSRSIKRKPSAAVARKTASNRRTGFVLAGLAIGLATTGALLKVLAPPPLAAEFASTALAAVAQDKPFEAVLDAAPASEPARWRSIYVHQSLTPSGNPQTLSDRDGRMADHFVIGNGDAMGDGAVQCGARWTQQLPAGALPGVRISGDCLSICLVGDFNSSPPSAAQQSRLVDLLRALQGRLKIPADHVILGLETRQSSAAGLGAQFPIDQLKSDLSR